MTTRTRTLLLTPVIAAVLSTTAVTPAHAAPEDPPPLEQVAATPIRASSLYTTCRASGTVAMVISYYVYSNGGRTVWKVDAKTNEASGMDVQMTSTVLSSSTGIRKFHVDRSTSTRVYDITNLPTGTQVRVACSDDYQGSLNQLVNLP